ncbi:hypothetical protein SAY87_029922 [Trapa incisa]|uniref:Protein kinase domain-containing protein n=1 Tax=Trapa incisa TaxID=236973 RepID=A0AAN7KCL0_9MYRT|nr:hypothetical protein SAY87_029922 [Trapa incisa]
MDEKIMLQPVTVPSDVETISLNVNGQSFASQLIQTEDLLDSSNSFIIDQDRFSMHSDAPFPPPKPMKIALRKDALGTRDPFSGSISVKVGEFNSDDIHSVNHLDLEKFQNLGATSSEIGPSGNEGVHEALPDEQIGKVDLEPHSEDNPEDTKANLPEKMNFGFPVSDGIGCLQIIKNSDLEELGELGSGTYGTIYHGKWRGTDVAIKRFNDRCFTGKASEQEQMAIKLADLHHPNVVAFYGIVLDGPGGSMTTVTEYMVNGSLRTALQKSERNLDKRKRLLIAMDVAFGMEYLHGKNIVHFDLKSDNLLVNLRDPHRPICKAPSSVFQVGDLGLSKVKCQTLISGGVQGTLPWMAPEHLNGSSSLVFEKVVDVFSFGIVMWELLTGEEPYADLHYGAIIGDRPYLKLVIPMERCWSSEPLERPSFIEIANELRSMSARTPSKPENLQ